MALPAKHRLNKKSFNQVKEKGRLYSHPWLGILVLENKERKNSCFGFLLSAKISKKANQRFKLKRQLSAIVYSLLVQIRPNLEIIFLPKKILKEKSFGEIEKAVKDLLFKSGSIKE